jgi:hypothetical protein
LFQGLAGKIQFIGKGEFCDSFSPQDGNFQGKACQVRWIAATEGLKMDQEIGFAWGEGNGSLEDFLPCWG